MSCFAVLSLLAAASGSGSTDKLPEGVLAKGVFKDHTYYLMRQGSWDQSEAAARKFGGHLVTINSKEEQDFIVKTFLKVSHDAGGGIWIGLHKLIDGTWAWSSREKVTYMNWAPTQPDNTGGIEDRVQLIEPGMPYEGQWNDFPNDVIFAFSRFSYGVVEFPTPPPAPETTGTGKVGN